MGVFGMGLADHDLGAGPTKGLGPFIAEREVDELHRGGLALGAGAVHVGLGHALDRCAAEAQKGGLLDAA